ncbi:MAG: hypothetical protein KJ958_01850, partial [Gammaproteobacteria bacterium]|nr:hypothetical protein [Gammaproteobacteria bacterium]
MKIKQTMRFLKSASAATALVLATSVNAAQISSASTTINWNDIQVYSNNQLLLNSEYTLRFPSFGGGLAYSNARTYPFPSGSMPYSSAPQFNQSVAEGNE